MDREREMTSDEQVAVPPFEVAEDDVERMSRVRDQDDFVRLCADEVGYGLPTSRVMLERDDWKDHARKDSYRALSSKGL